MKQRLTTLAKMFYRVMLIAPLLLSYGCNDTSMPENENSDAPDLTLDFETEPLTPAPTRISDPEGNHNNCLSETAYNAFYNYQICNAETCPVEDLIIENSRTHARSGDGSLRFFMKPSPLENWPGKTANHRAELGPERNASLYPYPSHGDEYWYAFSVYFPNDFVFAPEELKSDLRFIIAQWQHGTPGSPSIALEIYGDQIALAREEGVSTQSTWQWPVMLKTITKGVWMDLILQVKWSQTDGAVKIWINDEVVHDQSTIQTVYDDLDRGGAFKFGLYYWRWKEDTNVLKALNAGITNREIFIDALKLYKGQNGHSVVRTK